MNCSFYRGDIPKLLKKSKGSIAKFEAAVKAEQDKTADSLKNCTRKELVAIINELNVLYQLTSHTSTKKNVKIQVLEDIIEEHIGNIHSPNFVFGGTVGQVLKLSHEVVDEYKALNKVTMDLERRARHKREQFQEARDNYISKRIDKYSRDSEILYNAIIEYLKDNPRKTNKEIARFLRERGFQNDMKYTDSSFEKRVAVVAAKCRKNPQPSDS